MCVHFYRNSDPFLSPSWQSAVTSSQQVTLHTPDPRFGYTATGRQCLLEIVLSCLRRVISKTTKHLSEPCPLTLEIKHLENSTKKPSILSGGEDLGLLSAKLWWACTPSTDSMPLAKLIGTCGFGFCLQRDTSAVFPQREKKSQGSQISFFFVHSSFLLDIGRGWPAPKD